LDQRERAEDKKRPNPIAIDAAVARFDTSLRYSLPMAFAALRLAALQHRAGATHADLAMGFARMIGRGLGDRDRRALEERISHAIHVQRASTPSEIVRAALSGAGVAEAQIQGVLASDPDGIAGDKLSRGM